MLFVEITTSFKHDASDGGERFALDISFAAEPGVTVLFGPSGSGKSTTLAAIAGTLAPERGRIQIADRVLFDRERNINLPIRSRSIGMVFQDLALFEHMSVLHNVTYGLADKPREERLKLARAMLERFKIAHLENRRPAQISGGERQRTALARALVIEPKALLLDEPFNALDAVVKESIMEDLRRIARSTPIPILLVTHDRSEAIALGQHMLVYEKGRITARGAPLATLGAPRTLSTAALAGIENIFVCRIAAIHPERGTMTVMVGEVSIEVPYGGQSAGEAAHIAIGARDILLAIEEVRSTSARNVLPGVVVELQEKDLNIYVKVDCGIPLIALITKHAAEELAIKKGGRVWLAFKAHSCYLLAEN